MGLGEVVREPAGRRRRSLVVAVLLLAGVVVLAVAAPWRPGPTMPPSGASVSVGPSASGDTSPSASPSPSASAPTPSSGPGEPVVIGTVTTHPNLPPARPLERGLLAGAGEGWSLVEYSAVQADVPFTAGPTILYLAGPDGEVYQAHDFGVGAHVRLADWAATSSLVLVLTGPEGRSEGYTTVQALDLETGDVVASFDLEPGFGTFAASFTQPTGRNVVVRATNGERGWLKRFSLDGQELATLVAGVDQQGDWFSPTWLYGQDGTYVVVGGDGLSAAGDDGLSRVSVDGTTTTPIPLPAGTVSCRPIRWWDSTRLLAGCADDFGPNPGDPTLRLTGSNMWLIPMTGQAATRLSSHVSESVVDYGITDLWEVEGTRYARWYGDCGAVSFGTLDAGGIYTAEVSGVDVLGHRGETFVGRRLESCGDPGGELVVLNGPDGAVRVVVPRVGDAEGVRQVVVR